MGVKRGHKPFLATVSIVALDETGRAVRQDLRGFQDHLPKDSSSSWGRWGCLVQGTLRVGRPGNKPDPHSLPPCTGPCRSGGRGKGQVSLRGTRSPGRWPRQCRTRWQVPWAGPGGGRGWVAREEPAPSLRLPGPGTPARSSALWAPLLASPPGWSSPAVTTSASALLLRDLAINQQLQEAGVAVRQPQASSETMSSSSCP